MPFHVVDTSSRDFPAKSQATPQRHSNQECPRQTRTRGIRDRIGITATGLVEDRADQWHQQSDVVAGGELGYNAPVRLVGLDLRGQLMSK